MDLHGARAAMTARQLITLRVPVDQLERIDQLAEEARLSRTEYMTRCALGEAINPHSTEERLEQIEKRLTRVEEVEFG